MSHINVILLFVGIKIIITNNSNRFRLYTMYTFERLTIIIKRNRLIVYRMNDNIIGQKEGSN